MLKPSESYSGGFLFFEKSNALKELKILIFATIK